MEFLIKKLDEVYLSLMTKFLNELTAYYENIYEATAAKFWTKERIRFSLLNSIVD